MKYTLPILITLAIGALTSCAPPPPTPSQYIPTSGPTGSWRGMNGTDVISLTLSPTGSLTMTTPGQTLSGSWQIVAPAVATIRCNAYNGEFRLISESDAVFSFNQVSIEMYRAKVSTSAPSKPSEPSKPAAEPKRSESYYLNKIN